METLLDHFSLPFPSSRVQSSDTSFTDVALSAKYTKDLLPLRHVQFWADMGTVPKQCDKYPSPVLSQRRHQCWPSERMDSSGGGLHQRTNFQISFGNALLLLSRPSERRQQFCRIVESQWLCLKLVDHRRLSEQLILGKRHPASLSPSLNIMY